MNANHSITTMTAPHIDQIIPQIGLEAQQMLTLGHQRGWDFAVLGQAPMPQEAVRLGEWLVVPAQEDTSPVPTRALERVQAIFAAGLRPKGFVVVHEAPMLLPAPAQTETETPPSISVPELSPALKVAGNVLGTVGKAAAIATGLAVLATATVALGAVLAIPAALAAGALALDPLLIAVTEDDVWIEIDRWWD